MDGAILLVDGTEGVAHQTREHVLLARQVGVGHLVVFINKIDVADAELLDIVELEVRDLLEAHGFGGAPCVRGSALCALEAAAAGRMDDPYVARILELVEALDRHVPVPDRDLVSAFLMPIEGVHTIPGRGTVVTGRVARGVLAPGREVDVIGGQGTTLRAVVTGIQEFHHDVPSAEAGRNVGLLLRGVARDEVVRGQTVVLPDSLAPHREGEAEIFLLPEHEGGRTTPCASGYTPQFYFGATDVPGTLRFGDGTLAPGDRARVVFTLARPVALERGMRFAMREGGRTVGAGVIHAVT
jgi:elongation factor Tu